MLAISITCAAPNSAFLKFLLYTLTAGRDYGVLSGRTWRLADLGAKQSMLLAGLGWGNMPAHLVGDDIAQGRLKVIRPTEFDARAAQFVMCGAYLAEHRPGPATQGMLEYLSDRSRTSDANNGSGLTADWSSDVQLFRSSK